MKKFALFALAMSVATGAFAELDNTTWKTIDDKTGKPKALVSFKKQPNGTYNAQITTVLDPVNQNGCTTCTGKLKGKSLQGVTIVSNLKHAGGNKYAGGTIMDPQSSKSYKLNATLEGNKLQMRGYVGVSALGRTQTWVRN